MFHAQECGIMSEQTSAMFVVRNKLHIPLPSEKAAKGDANSRIVVPWCDPGRWGEFRARHNYFNDSKHFWISS